MRARYPFPRFPDHWAASQRWAFWVLSAVWVAASLILPPASIKSDSISFAVSLFAFYAWVWFFPWRWSVSQGSLGQ